MLETPEEIAALDSLLTASRARASAHLQGIVTPEKGLSSPFGGDSSVRERDLDAGAAEVDHCDQRVGGVESVSAV